ncbi:NACHT domain-containing protein [Lentzea sp. NPDC059081]|uniref:NACHT domain-containing protein n=1 Tax=Lentzea sp. NPDC059081 TaxID=3346719 RepID=UPI0036C20073
MGKILGLLAAAIGPPVATYVAFLQAWSKANPVLALVVLAAYEAVVLGFGFVSKLVGRTADELSNKWKDPLSKAIDEGTRRRLSRFERRYRQSVLGNLRFIDLKGLATMGFYTPELDEVFVDVSLVHSEPTKVPTDILGRPQVQPDRHFIGDLIDRPKPVVLAVIGAPGCGKTTLLRHTALLVCRTRRRRRRIPILLYLRDHLQAITNGTALPDLIDCNAPTGWFERKLRAGSCAVLLDGLDEVADQDNRRAVSDWVERQVALYPLNDFVITSRPHGYQTAPISGADIVQVRGFTDQQVTRFVRGWYLAFEQRSTGEKTPDIARRAEQEASDLLERLHQNTSLYELTVNPLLLTMIANVHKFRGALPGSRVDLYSEICQVLLWRRQEAKKLVSELTGDQKMKLLDGLAYSMMIRRRRDISRDQINLELRSSLRRTTQGMNVEEFLANMTSCGLLLERERDVFAFAHLTFQEYLAAHHIREKHLTRTLSDNVDNVWWRETTLLHVARANADPIVQACLDSGSVVALSLAFDCAEQGSELAPELRSRLDRLLETVHDSRANTDVRNFITRVVLSRHLRRLVRTDAGTHICMEPVPSRIYRLFLGSGPHSAPEVPLGNPDEPARSMWFGDALAFVDWLNRTAASELTFRLPRVKELTSSPLAAKLNSLSAYTADAGWQVQHSHFNVSGQEVQEDLIDDLTVLSQVSEVCYQVRDAQAWMPRPVGHTTMTTLRLLKLPVEASPTRNIEDQVGVAFSLASPNHPGAMPKARFTEKFNRTFSKLIESPNLPTLFVAPRDNYSEIIQKTQEARLSRWGEERLPDFMKAVTTAFIERRPLNFQGAAELRILAVCLAYETDPPDRARFQQLAAGVSIMRRRADGRLNRNETIILATG